MSIDQIISVLDELIDAHQLFIETGKEKTEVIKRGDMATLEKLINKEDVMTRRVHQLEKKRQDAVYHYLSSNDIIPEDMTLEQLIKMAPLGYKDQLKDRQLKLINEVLSLKDLNDLNRDLIEQSLQFVNLTINLLQPKATLTNYERPHQAGKSYSQLAPGRFDSKA